MDEQDDLFNVDEIDSAPVASVEDRKLLQQFNLPISQAGYDQIFQSLLKNIQWQKDSYTAFARQFEIPRQQAWYADSGIEYRYADNILQSQTWLPLLLELRSLLEQSTEYRFNAVLATLYRNGDDSVGWHSDDEKELGNRPAIASLSLGATRRFEFRHRQTDEQRSIALKHGDWLIMPPGFQEQWQHRIPAQPEINEPRINLTFRQVISAPG